jgi:Leucine-rich repeat (LRR) protein
MNLGSTTDIGTLAELPHLQKLLLHEVRGLANLTPLANATGLRYLYLADLREVATLFDMTNLTDLTEATISLPNLTDLRPVLSAPNLTTLSVPHAPALDPTSWRDTCTGWLAQGKPPFWE